MEPSHWESELSCPRAGFQMASPFEGCMACKEPATRCRHTQRFLGVLATREFLSLRWEALTHHTLTTVGSTQRAAPTGRGLASAAMAVLTGGPPLCSHFTQRLPCRLCPTALPVHTRRWADPILLAAAVLL